MNCNLVRTLRWKKWGFSCEKDFFRVFTTRICASREMLWGNGISLSRKFIFIVFGVWVISLSFCKILWSGVSSHRSACGENKIGEIILENLFSLINFGLWGEKTWTFSKTVRHDSQNRSLPVQMTVFRKICGSKNSCLKAFGHWTETSYFRRKHFPRVVKGTVHVSSATLWENDENGKFYILWLVEDFVCFLTLTGKLVRCIKGTSQVYRGKIYWIFFCRRCFFKTFSDFEQRNLEF